MSIKKLLNKLLCKIVGHKMDEHTYRQGGSMCARCGFFMEHPSWKVERENLKIKEEQENSLLNCELRKKEIFENKNSQNKGIELNTMVAQLQRKEEEIKKNSLKIIELTALNKTLTDECLNCNRNNQNKKLKAILIIIQGLLIGGRPLSAQEEVTKILKELEVENG
ncbi:MAG: DUF1660 family phage protein [Candidatus Gastranaerophilales bacterium]|nr:DUF1660 family phage protein [Candidatus Gastranaerophilales bacterium]